VVMKQFKAGARYSILVLILLVLSPAQLGASLGSKDCPTVDYSDRFGPIRDQDGHDLCWAFVGAALLEEQLCIKDPSLCGKSVSPVDVSRCKWIMGSGNENAPANAGIKCVVEQGGACFEDDAPYSPITSLPCSLWEFVGYDSAKCNNIRLAKYYDRWQRKLRRYCKKNSAATVTPSALQSIKDAQNALIKSMKDDFPEQALLGEDLHYLFNSSRDTLEFFKRVMIRKQCIEKRQSVKKRIKEMKTSEPSSGAERRKMTHFITTALKSGRSVAVGMDVHKFDKEESFTKEEFNHAVVIVGMRYNNKSKKCEYNVKNSWGEGAFLHGWFPVDRMEDAIFQGNYLDD
jgi:hypothetical protein